MYLLLERSSFWHCTCSETDAYIDRGFPVKPKRTLTRVFRERDSWVVNFALGYRPAGLALAVTPVYLLLTHVFHYVLCWILFLNLNVDYIPVKIGYKWDPLNSSLYALLELTFRVLLYAVLVQQSVDNYSRTYFYSLQSFTFYYLCLWLNLELWLVMVLNIILMI